MLPALTIGPALYLLFCKLTDNLQSQYKVSYRSPSGETSEKVDSTYTVEEVLLMALSSVCCFQTYSDLPEFSSAEAADEHRELIESCSKSKARALVFGTYADDVTGKQISELDKNLQRSIWSTDSFKKVVDWKSKDRMVHPINNLNGGEGEIEEIRKKLEDCIYNCFKPMKVPVAWLVLSLCLRCTKQKTVKLNDVFALGGELGMTKDQTKLALWFLHHCAGDLMYFPNLPELKDTVITNPQIVYDSASCLIIDTFSCEHHMLYITNSVRARFA